MPGVFTADWWTFYGLLQIYPVGSLEPLVDPLCLQGPGCGLAATWSLAVEVSFYALLPLYVLAMGRLMAPSGGRRWVRNELLVILALAVLSLGVRGWATIDHELAFLRVTLAGNFLWLAVGLALAVASVALQARKEGARAFRFLANHSWLPWVAALALYVLVILVRPGLHLMAMDPFDRGVPGALVEHVLLAAIAGLVLVPAVFGDSEGGLPRRILANRTLGWLGIISYGMFLWHLPILYKLRDAGATELIPDRPFLALTLATLAITTVCAAASYYGLERPLMRLKHRRREREVVSLQRREVLPPRTL